MQVVACTLCGSDIHTMQGSRKEPVPTVLGHEMLGRIAAFGPTANASRRRRPARSTWATA